MSKPKRPPTYDELPYVWLEYYRRMDAWRKRKQKDWQKYASKNREKLKECNRRYNATHIVEHREYRQKRLSDPVYRAGEIERVQRWIEEHPYCNLEKMEQILRMLERNKPLEYSKDYDQGREA